MQQYLTLDEAAKVLQMSPDELREMAKKKTIRAFQDRGSWRFRTQDIQELARARGLTSDPDAPQPAHPSSAKKGDDALAVDFSLDDDDSDEVPIGKEKPADKGSKGSGRSGKPHTPKPGSDSDVRLVLDSNMDFDIDLENEVKIESSGPKSTPKSSPKSSSPKPGKRNTKAHGGDSGVRLVPPEDASDSDVKLEPSGKDSGVSKRSKSPSDSDIRLHDMPPGTGKRDQAGMITEEIDLDAEAARLAEQKPKKGKAPKPTQMANPTMLPTSSPFELSEDEIDLDDRKKDGGSSKSGKRSGPKSGAKSTPKKKAERDSSSDFELVAFDASKSPENLGSGEVPLLSGDESVDLGSEVAGPGAGQSGINLQDPGDSGISLESGGSDEIEFELSVDSGMTPKPAAKSGPQKAEDDSSSDFELSLDDSDEADSSSEFELSLDEDADIEVKEGSDSEFELTLDDEGGLAVEDEAQDIFEETNFDVPALEDESGSEAVALDEEGTDVESSSDFEISLDSDVDSDVEDSDSGSQVVALDDEEDADAGAATIARPRKKGAAKPGAAKAGADEEAGEESDFDLGDSDEAPAPKKKKAPASDEDVVVEEEADEDELVAAAAPAAVEWDAWTVVPLFPTVLVLFVVGIMGFEVLRGMWGYHRPSAVGQPIIDTIARQFDESLPKK